MCSRAHRLRSPKPPAKWEHHVNGWKATQIAALLPVGEARWLTDLTATAEWKLLKDARDTLTHSWMRQDITVSGGSIYSAVTVGGNPPPLRPPEPKLPFRSHGRIDFHVGRQKHDLRPFLEQVVRFGVDQWLGFCDIVAR